MAGKPDQPSRRTTLSRGTKVGIAVAAVVVLLLAAWAIYRWSADTNRETAAARANMSGMAELSAEQLAAAYDEDAVGADIRYGNRRLRVSGRVHSITGGAGGPVVVLGGEDPLLTVTASFDRAQADRVATMTADGRLTIVCTRTELVATSPALGDCRIEQ